MKKVFGKTSFFFVFASPDWQAGPDLHLLCKYKSLVRREWKILTQACKLEFPFQLQAAEESEGLLPKYPSYGIFVTRDLWTSVIMSKGIHRPSSCTHMVQSIWPLCNFTFWHPIDQNCAPSWALIQLSSDPRVRNVAEWNQFLKPFRKIKLGNKFCEVPRTPADDIVACNVPIELLTALSSIQIVVQTQIYGNNFFS